MNISGKELKELIPDGVVFCLDSMQILDKDDTHAILTLGHKHGSMSVLVYRKSLGKLLLRTPETPAKADKPPSTQAPTVAQSVQTPAKGDDTEEGRVYSIGMTRKKDGVTQRLEGFSASSSLREKPTTAQRRVQHPVTKQMVWPLWVEVKED